MGVNKGVVLDVVGPTLGHSIAMENEGSGVTVDPAVFNPVAPMIVKCIETKVDGFKDELLFATRNA